MSVLSRRLTKDNPESEGCKALAAAECLVCCHVEQHTGHSGWRTDTTTSQETSSNVTETSTDINNNDTDSERFICHDSRPLLEQMGVQ